MGELLLLPTYIPYLHTFSPAASTQNSAETHTRMAGGGTWDHFYGPSIVTWQGLRVLMPGYFVQHSFFCAVVFEATLRSNGNDSFDKAGKSYPLTCPNLPINLLQCSLVLLTVGIYTRFSFAGGRRDTCLTDQNHYMIPSKWINHAATIPYLKLAWYFVQPMYIRPLAAVTGQTGLSQR